MHCLNGFDSIPSLIAWRFKSIALRESIQQVGRGFFPNPHRAVSLNITMSPDWASPGTRSPNVSSQQQEVNNLSNRRNRVLMLRKSHCPATDDFFSAERYLGCLANLGAIQIAASGNLFPVRPIQRRDQCVVTSRVASDKFVIENLPRQ